MYTCMNLCVYMYTCICMYSPIVIMVWVFANSPGGKGSIAGRVIAKTQKKWYLIRPCLTLSIIKYGWSIVAIENGTYGSCFTIVGLHVCKCINRRVYVCIYVYTRQHIYIYVCAYIYIYK